MCRRLSISELTNGVRRSKSFIGGFQTILASASLLRVTTSNSRQRCVFAFIGALLALSVVISRATPANKAALEKHYDKFLSKNLARCTTCHLPSDNKNPESLDEFPHNPFGERLRAAGLPFRNDIVTGPGGSQVLFDDPSGNPIEFFQPAAR